MASKSDSMFNEDPAEMPDLVPNPIRVSQLKQENLNCVDWDSDGEKEFNENVTIVQSWEELSLDSISTDDDSSTRSSFSLCDQLNDDTGSVASSSGSTSSSTSFRKVLRRSRSRSLFSPCRSSPRKSLTISWTPVMSPIKMRPSLLSFEKGVKRKHDWDYKPMEKMNHSSQSQK